MASRAESKGKIYSSNPLIRFERIKHNILNTTNRLTNAVYRLQAMFFYLGEAGLRPAAPRMFRDVSWRATSHGRGLAAVALRRIATIRGRSL